MMDADDQDEMNRQKESNVKLFVDAFKNSERNRCDAIL